MNEREVSEALVDWIGEELVIPAEARYPYPVAIKEGPMTTDQPDVAALVERKRLMLAREAEAIFPWLRLQQVELVRVFDCVASVMLAVEDDEASARDVFQRLQGYGETLEASATKDSTLGERVPMISPAMAFDYSAVFGETEDGTRGRLVALELTVGEQAEEGWG